MLEVLVGTVIKEAESAASGCGVVDDFGHQAFVFPEIEFVPYPDFPGRIYYDIPQSLFLVQFAQEENFDFGFRLLLVSVKSCRKHFGVIQDESVSLAEIVYYILEEFVLYFPCVLMKNHQLAFVSPSRRFLCYLVIGEVELEL